MLLALLLSLAQPALPTRLPPVDRCRGDAAFAAFRTDLNRAVRTRDLAALKALMDEGVVLSFGGVRGPAALDGIEGRGKEAFWAALDEVLQLGCAGRLDGQGAEYRAFPAMFVTSAGLNGFDTQVSQPGAVLREKPFATARVRARLRAWTVLDEVADEGGDWLQVRTRQGLTGYVERGLLRSPIDYRLVAGRRGGQWRVTAFVAGD